MKVLIIKTSALGDIIHALPVLDFLHQVSPGIEVSWVVEESNREVLEGNPLLHRLLLFRSHFWRRHLHSSNAWREIAAFRRQLKKEDYDYVFDIMGNLKSGVISRNTGCREIYGFAGEELQESVNRFFTVHQIHMHQEDRHITDKCLRIVSAPFGGSFEGMSLKSAVATSQTDDRAAETLLASFGKGPVLLFHWGTTWQTKFWNDTGWIELGRKILGRYPDAAILFSWGNQTELKKVSDIARSIGPGTHILEQYTLKGLCALLKKVDLVVGGDTGPVHLAAAVGTPTVSLYRSSDGRRTGPRGDQHIIIRSPLDCACCFKTVCSRDEECRNSITPDMVFKGCMDSLENY
jgi:heptosyltransferase I